MKNERFLFKVPHIDKLYRILMSDGCQKYDRYRDGHGIFTNKKFYNSCLNF